MAGAYADYPSNRMAIDLDGTKLVTIDSGSSIVELSGSLVTSANSETGTVDIAIANVTPLRLAAIFPEKRDIGGIYVGYTSGGTPTVGTFQWSADTTNGLDGTWTGFTYTPTNGAVNPAYRTSVSSQALTGVKAIRFTLQTGYSSDWCRIRAFHLFGKIAAGENPDRLEIWHPTLDQRIGAAAFDWGNAARNGSADLTFRVKNRSATKTANSITVSIDSLTDTTPSFQGAHYVSADGSTFTATINIGGLAHDAISGVLTLRRVLSSTAVLSLWAARLKAIAASWT